MRYVNACGKMTSRYENSFKSTRQLQVLVANYGKRPATYAKQLADAIYGQPEVLDALRQHPASSAAGIITVKALRKEMKALEEASEMFGGCKVDSDQDSPTEAGEGQVTLTRDDVGVEDYEAILGDMKFEQMFREVETRAPIPFGLLTGLMAPKVMRKDRGPRNPTKFNNRLAIVTSILCYSRASEGSNKFPRVFGAYLQSNGVKGPASSVSVIQRARIDITDHVATALKGFYYGFKSFVVDDLPMSKHGRGIYGDVCIVKMAPERYCARGFRIIKWKGKEIDDLHNELSRFAVYDDITMDVVDTGLWKEVSNRVNVPI